MTPVLADALMPDNCCWKESTPYCTCLVLVSQRTLSFVSMNRSTEQILEERTKELSKKQRHLSTGETRQFDYRPVGEKNPLFARLGEKERR